MSFQIDILKKENMFQAISFTNNSNFIEMSSLFLLCMTDKNHSLNIHVTIICDWEIGCFEIVIGELYDN